VITGLDADGMFHAAGILVSGRFIQFKHIGEKTAQHDMPLQDFLRPSVSYIRQIDLTVIRVVNQPGFLQQLNRFVDTGTADLQMISDVD